ncbi:hypothetical protein [Caulobacter sp. 1776]|uniref:hypothetical protein n=1 Tax=Caulobacter sp. 1776 TaxID=3156420 RepID=UPI0033935F17
MLLASIGEDLATEPGAVAVTIWKTRPRHPLVREITYEFPTEAGGLTLERMADVRRAHRLGGFPGLTW